MSKYFKTIKNFYDKGLWSKAKVADAVEKGLITAEEYELITGEPYEA
jgi:uncharacterized XkdX family phage protein